MKVGRLSAPHRGRLYSWKYIWYSFLLQAEFNTEPLRILMKISGMEPATLRMVAEYLSQLLYRRAPMYNN